MPLHGRGTRTLGALNDPTGFFLWHQVRISNRRAELVLFLDCGLQVEQRLWIDWSNRRRERRAGPRFGRPAKPNKV